MPIAGKYVANAAATVYYGGHKFLGRQHLSNLLSNRRLRQTYRLVLDVIRLGHNANSWTTRLLEGLTELFKAKFSALAWAQLPDKPGGHSRSEVNLQYGLSAEEIALWASTYASPDGEIRSEFLRG